MRIKVNFTTEKLPILYRHRFMALIKEALKSSDKNYKDRLYPDKALNREVVKPFSFSILMPAEKTIEKEKIFFEDRVSVEDTVFYFPLGSFISLLISSSDYEFIMNLYNGLLQMKSFEFNREIMLKLHKVYVINEKKINTDEVIFKTLSPILLEDKNNKPILHDFLNESKHSNSIYYPQSIFNQHFSQIHRSILKDLRGEGLYEPIEFFPVKIKKQVIKHTLKGFREKTGKPYMTFTCFEGCFKLKGDRRDLQMLYQIGIGLRTGQGFGMVEVV